MLFYMRPEECAFSVAYEGRCVLWCFKLYGHDRDEEARWVTLWVSECKCFAARVSEFVLKPRAIELIKPLVKCLAAGLADVNKP